VDNPKLVQSADLAAFNWLPEVTVAHSEVRSDRFVVAVDRNPEDTGELTFAYVVRAVTPGTYVHPPAVVEDMYRPHLSARTATGRMEVTGPRP
jgi:alpha-2-macroglobulin